MAKPEFCGNCEHLLHVQNREWRCKRWAIKGEGEFKLLPVTRISWAGFEPTRHYKCRESGKWFEEATK